MPIPHGAHIERMFIPMVPCPDGAPHFHIPKAVMERYKTWDYVDTFIDPKTGEAWMLTAKPREEEN